MPKKYSEEIKNIVINRALQGADLNKLAKDFDIISGKQIIKIWLERYNNSEESNNYKLNCKGDYIMSKDIENAVLLNKIEELEAKNKELDKKLIDSETKRIYLEKHMPSCLILKMEENQAKKVMKSKKYKFEIYKEIYKTSKNHGLKISYLCSIFKVSRDKFNEWILKNKLPRPYKLFQEKLDFDLDSVKFTSKVDPNAKKYVMAYFDRTTGPGISCGTRIIRKWIFITYTVHISEKAIATIIKLFPNHRKTIKRYNSKKSLSGVDKSQAYIREDLVGKDTVTERFGQVIRMDGTLFKIYIKNRLSYELCEIAYDWYTRNIVAHNFDKSENKNVVLKTIKQIHEVLLENEVANSIIQMDRGRPNASKDLKNFENSQNQFKISMSKAGFKHNAPTEAMNGWIKEQFICTYGDHIDSSEEFRNLFKEFVLRKNIIQNIVYNNKKGQELRI